MKKLLLFTVLLLGFSAIAQRRNKDANYIGVSFGVNQLTLNTSSIDATVESGFQGGLSVRGNFYNDWDMVFGMQFSETRLSFDSKEAVTSKIEKVEFKLPGVQVFVTPSYKIVENHLSVEFGPMIQINDKFKYQSDLETNTLLTNSNVTVKDFASVSNLNISLIAGITAGLKHLRVNVQYQAGVTNLLNKVNNGDFGASTNFTGRTGTLVGNLIVYF
jgi:Outer membrane protein beta-barrel domain